MLVRKTRIYQATCTLYTHVVFIFMYNVHTLYMYLWYTCTCSYLAGYVHLYYADSHNNIVRAYTIVAA